MPQSMVPCYLETDVKSYDTSHSLMAPVFVNGSCTPWAPRDEPCEVGAHVQYAVDVATTEHVAKTIHFAKERNIRLVIRNTGHEYAATGSILQAWTEP